MEHPPTIRDLAESIAGLREAAQDLRSTARCPRLRDFPEAVPATVAGLMKTADYLERVVEELLVLLPDTPIPPLAGG